MPDGNPRWEVPPPHLNLIRARVGALVNYHSPLIGVPTIRGARVRWEVVPVLAWPNHWCAGVAWGKTRVEFSRKVITRKWPNMDWLDDLVVHELMHLKIDEPRGVMHGPAYKKAMVEYGYHPIAMGWRPDRRIPALE